MTETEKLLAVLNMTEEEQRKSIARFLDWPKGHKLKAVCKRSPLRGEIPELWVLICEWCSKEWEHPKLKQIPDQDPEFIAEINKREPCQKIRYEGSFVDLAFRRRDEVKKEHKEQWLRACFIVSEHLFNPEGGREYRSFRGFEAEHEILQGKAIWWIIAAEITEQLAKDK